MTIPALPKGYVAIPDGQFEDGDHTQHPVEAFNMKATPVTNAEWSAFAQSLGTFRYVSLRYNYDTGKAILEKYGPSIEIVAGGPVDVPDDTNFDQGDVLFLGSLILLKIVDNPSKRFDEHPNFSDGIKFSRENQPVVGVSYFHAMAWCLLMSKQSRGQLEYDLPTDLQYEYVASDRGTKEYGTESGDLARDDCDPKAQVNQQWYNNRIINKCKLAHVSFSEMDQKYPPIQTMSVNDTAYAQKLPFGIQTTGNVWRWTKFNPDLRGIDGFFGKAYGLRGGSWKTHWHDATAEFRYPYHPDPFRINSHATYIGNGIGFQPVVRKVSE